MSDALEIALALTYAMLAAAAALTLVRLFRGPSLIDRVLALDLLALVLVGLLATAAIDRNEAANVDVAVVIALVGFVGAVAYARFLEEEGPRD